MLFDLTLHQCFCVDHELLPVWRPLHLAWMFDLGRVTRAGCTPGCSRCRSVAADGCRCDGDGTVLLYQAGRRAGLSSALLRCRTASPSSSGWRRLRRTRRARSEARAWSGLGKAPVHAGGCREEAAMRCMAGRCNGRALYACSWQAQLAGAVVVIVEVAFGR